MSDYKFKIGDKVKLISDCYESSNLPAGIIGVVKALHDPFVPWPYYIEYEGHDGLIQGTTKDNDGADVSGLWPHSADELEYVA